MNFFEYTDKELFFRNDGELLSIMAWGNNSLRVQSSLMDNNAYAVVSDPDGVRTHDLRRDRAAL